MKKITKKREKRKMWRFAEYDLRKQILKKEKKDNAELLHKFVLGINGDRQNRNRLREFEEFEYVEIIEKFLKKN